MLPKNPTLKDFLEEIDRLNEEHFDEQDYSSIPFLILALSGEVGELCNAYKKIMRGQDTTKFIDNIKEELADVLVYTFMVCRGLDVDVEKILRKRMYEIEERGGAGYYGS